MRGANANPIIDPQFELPAQFVVAERRMAGRAIDLWRAGRGAPVAELASHSLVLSDPAGAQVIESVGEAIAARFGLVAGTPLAGDNPLVLAIRDACAEMAGDRQPVQFECNMQMPTTGLILARGVALPIDGGAGADRVQIVLSWREALDQAGTARLQRELRASLRIIVPIVSKADPFLPQTGLSHGG